jgi:hypothetical protein
MEWFMFLPLIVVPAFLGAGAYFLPYIRRHWRRVGEWESTPNVDRLLESIDDLTAQVKLLEEEKDFYRELNSPRDSPQIEAESGEEPDSGGR